MNEHINQPETRVVIAGVGLIGGSIAAAIRKRQPSCEVIGLGRNKERLQAAVSAGILTSWTTEMSHGLLNDRVLVVVCLPVNLIADTVIAIAKNAGPEVLITDAGSVKSIICNKVASDAKAAKRFIGAHPIAGGEHGGFENADSELFQNRTCVLVEEPGNTKSAPTQMLRAELFWRGIGCQIVKMTAEDHDRILALTSHLPHLMAAVTASAVGPQNLRLTGSGFRDTTRVAAGDASLWKEIFANNRGPVIEAIDTAQSLLGRYRAALIENDGTSIEELLREASSCRSKIST